MGGCRCGERCGVDPGGRVSGALALGRGPGEMAGTSQYQSQVVLDRPRVSGGPGTCSLVDWGSTRCICDFWISL